MRIKSIEMKNFKRFTHLTIDNIPKTAKLVVLIGPNGSGKTSVMEAINYFYQYSGYGTLGDYDYFYKEDNGDNHTKSEWVRNPQEIINIIFHNFELTDRIRQRNDIRKSFYFRSTYRNEPSFQIQTIQKQDDPTEVLRLENLTKNDQTVSSNYHRIIANTISGIYDKNNNEKTVVELRDELVGKIGGSINRIFSDLEFSSIGNPSINGNFYFTKGTSKDFNYQNLSAGEKSVFDLILDIIIKSEYYPSAIYCIDEPEIHMHTKLQSKVLRELYSLVSDQSQLWISTHSIGMLQEAEDIERENPGTVVFLDFGNGDFDTGQTICPSMLRKAVMDKFYELAFGDFSKLLLPKTIVFCEGDPNGNKRKNFDKTIYSKIFADTHPEAFFISAGSCTDIENIEKTSGEIIQTLLNNVKIIKIIDRDDRSKEEISKLMKKGIRVLKERNLESYLLDNSVIEKLCREYGKPEKYADCIKAKDDAIKASNKKGYPPDDYKHVRGEICNALKKHLKLTECGNNADAFIQYTLVPLISPDMDVYKELDAKIFGETEEGDNA